MTRIAGVVATVATLTGATLLTWSVLATQGWWYPGYVSETGVAGEPHTTAYKASLYAVAVALAALAVGLRRAPGLVRGAAGLFAVAAALATVSGSVSCSPGCPLPPYATPTPGDLVHGGASTAAVGLVGLAILLLALPMADSPLRGLSRAILVPLVPAGLAVAFALAALGRGYTVGVTERLVLLIELAFMALAGLTLTRR